MNSLSKKLPRISNRRQKQRPSAGLFGQLRFVVGGAVLTSGNGLRSFRNVGFEGGRRGHDGPDAAVTVDVADDVRPVDGLEIAGN
jgi:hypothetical protein